MRENQKNVKLQFSALDYTQQDKFRKADYKIQFINNEGWKVYRDDQIYLTLGQGYRLLKTKLCGICSTDLDRRFLPFPLPQVIGHEILAEDVSPNKPHKKYVIEINDSHEARGEEHNDPFCQAGLSTHCPERLTLGINMLPGGFGPYILAPSRSIIPCDFLPDKVAVLIQPFAAALQAVIASPPKDGYEVAVLGPRRLGNLIIAALKSFRKSNHLNFKIAAIVRHQKLQQLSSIMGADTVINLTKTQINMLKGKYDIVYDTTSTASGFISSLGLTKNQLHLKTTNGQIMNGIPHLTELVVDELSLLNIENKQNFKFHWDSEKRANKTIYICKSLQDRYNWLAKEYQIFNGTPQQASKYLRSSLWKHGLPRFDLAIAGCPTEIGSCIRWNQKGEQSLVRPRGAILIDTSQAQSWQSSKQTRQFFMQGKIIRTSRCGDFRLALKILEQNPQVVECLQKNMISHIFSSAKLEEAYYRAREPDSIKIILDHSV